MLDRLRFYWFFDKQRFAEALACCSRGRCGISAFEHHALYRLSLFRSAAAVQPSMRNWRSLVAAVVSLAACGRTNEASALLGSVHVQQCLNPHRAMLAGALVPFAPNLAGGLLSEDAPLTLQVAISLRLGERARALDLLKAAMVSESTSPELHLYANNAESLLPAAQLANMNAFLAAHGVSPLALCNQDQAPGAMNLKPDGSMPPVHGPLVSILMTAFRSAERIASAIDSLLGQTYQDIELIVIDDASDDATEAVVKAIAARDNRVRYIRLPVNVGTYVAKSIGLRQAQGEFVSCHDSDDWAHPQKIAFQMQPLLADASVVFTTSNWVRIQDDGVFYARPVHPLLRINPASPLFRKSVVLERAGAWDWVRTGADSEFLARLKLVFGRRGMRRIQKPLTFGAHRLDSLMTAAGTGYNQHGVSPTRLDYWEAWGHWHIEALRRGGPPKMPMDMLSERLFEAPDAIRVSRSSIAQCLAEVG
jgi:hypothetical protein